MYLLPVANWPEVGSAFYKGMRALALRNLLVGLPDDYVITTNHVGNLAIMAEDGVTQRGYIDLGSEMKIMDMES
jgi:hypothetical protein